MRLEGVEVDEEKTFSEPELLAEIMEIREAVEEAADHRALIVIQAQMHMKMNIPAAWHFTKVTYDSSGTTGAHLFREFGMKSNPQIGTSFILM